MLRGHKAPRSGPCGLRCRRLGLLGCGCPRGIGRGRRQYMGIMRSRYEGSFSPTPSRTSKLIPGNRRDFYLAGRGMRTYLQSKSNFLCIISAKLPNLTHPRNGFMLEEELRLPLVDLYADLAAHTKPECTRRCKRAARRGTASSRSSLRATTGARSFGRPGIPRRGFSTNGRASRQSNQAQIVRPSHEPAPQSFRQI
jgi:hypothetical protein